MAGFPSTSSAAAHEIGETPGSHVFAKVSARCFHFFCGIAPLWERSCILFLISVFVRPNWVRHNVGRGPFLTAFHRPPRRAAPGEVWRHSEYSGPADAPQSFQKGIRGKLGGRPGHPKDFLRTGKAKADPPGREGEGKGVSNSFPIVSVESSGKSLL